MKKKETKKTPEIEKTDRREIEHETIHPGEDDMGGTPRYV
ncbi:hypothetical protein HNQ41_002705 [Texcoconibacillus texcoconensis]|uniref:Uncharacterized protein n=1 Tax=Texcoconibacillus texcoconensis TaxID=1095777 RepID=A0A840QT18_9BACI|nr:hypothetical protein [Texcoconibacillus texcoconensis]